MALVLRVHGDEPIQIGDARIIVKVDRRNRSLVKVVIDAPPDIHVERLAPGTRLIDPPAAPPPLALVEPNVPDEPVFPWDDDADDLPF